MTKSRCNKYFVWSLAAVSKNNRFEQKSRLALIKSVFEVDFLIVSALHLQYQMNQNVSYVQYWIFGNCYLLKYCAMMNIFAVNQIIRYHGVFS